jgi:hypothetical protein
VSDGCLTSSLEITSDRGSKALSLNVSRNLCGVLYFFAVIHRLADPVYTDQFGQFSEPKNQTRNRDADHPVARA